MRDFFLKIGIDSKVKFVDFAENRSQFLEIKIQKADIWKFKQVLRGYMGLVGKKAPDFSVKACVKGKIEDFRLSTLEGKYVLLFFYPLDFTFVCPTELHAFQEKLSEFEAKNVHVLGCSVDSCFAHAAWLKTPRKMGGIEGIQYPLLSDVTKDVARSFDVLKEEDGIAYRGLFLIDKQGVVRHQIVNDLPLGRSVDEALRMIDALIFHENHGEVCPANWQKGKQSMKATAEGLVDYYAREVR